MKRGKKKGGNYIKKGGKGLKNASFWAIISKNHFVYFEWIVSLQKETKNIHNTYIWP